MNLATSCFTCRARVSLKCTSFAESARRGAASGARGSNSSIPCRDEEREVSEGLAGLGASIQAPPPPPQRWGSGEVFAICLEKGCEGRHHGRVHDIPSGGDLPCAGREADAQHLAHHQEQVRGQLPDPLSSNPLMTPLRRAVHPTFSVMCSATAA